MAGKPLILRIRKSGVNGTAANFRRTATSGQTEQFGSEGGFPGDLIGAAADRQVRRPQPARHHGGRAGQLGQPFGPARAARPVAVLVPPPVLKKEKAVLDLPVGARHRQQLAGCHPPRIEAGQNMASRRAPPCRLRRLRPDQHAARSALRGSPIAGEGNRRCPGPPPRAGDRWSPLFSMLSAAGDRWRASPKATCTASSTSG
jgi:hypothetical protein